MREHKGWWSWIPWMGSLVSVALLAVSAAIALQAGAVSAKKRDTSSPTETKTIFIKEEHLNTYRNCKDSVIEWHFVITQVEPASNAPPSITVSFQHAGTMTVPLYGVNGKTAHYYAYTGSPEKLIDARAEIYSDWNDQFNLSHAECVGSGDESGGGTGGDT
ncbi:MAG: hypothetical protein ACK42I_07890, partial [Thermomicrobium sp.]